MTIFLTGIPGLNQPAGVVPSEHAAAQHGHPALAHPPDSDGRARAAISPGSRTAPRRRRRDRHRPAGGGRRDAADAGFNLAPNNQLGDGVERQRRAVPAGVPLPRHSSRGEPADDCASAAASDRGLALAGALVAGRVLAMAAGGRQQRPSARPLHLGTPLETGPADARSRAAAVARPSWPPNPANARCGGAACRDRAARGTRDRQRRPRDRGRSRAPPSRSPARTSYEGERVLAALAAQPASLH